MKVLSIIRFTICFAENESEIFLWWYHNYYYTIIMFHHDCQEQKNESESENLIMIGQ